MKKLLLTIIFTSSAIVSFSQENQEVEGNNSRAFLETRIGVVRYNYFDLMAPSLELKLGTSIGKYLHMGGFVSGYTCVNQAEGENLLGKNYLFSPKGLSVGMVFRVSTNPVKSHFYGELTGSAGKAFDTGFYSSGEEINAAEYLLGANLGCNFKSSYGYFWGIYAGFSLGVLDFDHSSNEERVGRLHIGLTYHNQF